MLATCEESETDAELAQKLARLQPFLNLAVFPQECTGHRASFWANLTPSFLVKGVLLPRRALPGGGGGLREHGVPALVGEARAEARRSNRASGPEGAEGLRSRLGAGV